MIDLDETRDKDWWIAEYQTRIKQLSIQLDIAKKENDRASETFIHNFGLMQENRRLREALQVLIDCTYNEEGLEWSSSMEELQTIAKEALEI